MTTFCAYCRRQHRPEVTQCDGCGAPKTRQSVPSVYLTSDVIDVTHLRTLGATREARVYLRGLSVPKNIEVRS